MITTEAGKGKKNIENTSSDELSKELPACFDEDSLEMVAASKEAEDRSDEVDTPSVPKTDLPFTLDMERQILALMLQDVSFRENASHSIKPEHFDDAKHISIAKIVLDYHNKFPHSSITRAVVLEEILTLHSKKKLEDCEVPYYEKACTELFADPIEEREYVRSKVHDFIASKMMEDAIRGSVDHYGKGHYDKIVEEVTAAYEFGMCADSVIKDVPIFASFGDLLDKIESGEETKSVTTGFPQLDEMMLAGGVEPGELFIWIGTPGRGKSVALMNSACKQILAGHNVLYYTLEMGETIYRKRFLSCLTGVKIKSIMEGSSGDAVKSARLRSDIIRDKYPKIGEVRIRDIVDGNLTPNHIKNDLQKYADQGIRIDSLIVDYADLMRANGKWSNDNFRLEQGEVYRSLRSIAKTFKIPVFTASQGNREALNKKTVDMDSVAEDFSKARTAEYVIGLCQTSADKGELRKGTYGTSVGTGAMRFFIAKNRNGAAGDYIKVYTDFSTLRLDYDDWVKFDSRLFGPSKTYKKASV